MVPYVQPSCVALVSSHSPHLDRCPVLRCGRENVLRPLSCPYSIDVTYRLGEDDVSVNPSSSLMGIQRTAMLRTFWNLRMSFPTARVPRETRRRIVLLFTSLATLVIYKTTPTSPSLSHNPLPTLNISWPDTESREFEGNSNKVFEVLHGRTFVYEVDPSTRFLVTRATGFCNPYDHTTDALASYSDRNQTSDFCSPMP